MTASLQTDRGRQAGRHADREKEWVVTHYFTVNWRIKEEAQSRRMPQSESLRSLDHCKVLIIAKSWPLRSPDHYEVLIIAKSWSLVSLLRWTERTSWRKWGSWLDWETRTSSVWSESVRCMNLSASSLNTWSMATSINSFAVTLQRMWTTRFDEQPPTQVLY